MLTKKDLDKGLKQVRQEFKSDFDELKQQIDQNHTRLVTFLAENFVTKHEFEPFAEKVVELNDKVNNLNDGFADLADFIKKYVPITDDRIDKAIKRIDRLEVKVFIH